MTISERIEELEAGFRHLVDGLLAVVRVLQDENATLTARLDERRLMVPEVITKVVATEVIVPLPERQELPESLEQKPYKRKPPALVEKNCSDCNKLMTCLPSRHKCNDCFKAQMSDRMKKWHKGRRSA